MYSYYLPLTSRTTLCAVSYVDKSGRPGQPTLQVPGMGQKCELHFESFRVAGALDSKGTFEYVQIQQVLLVLCFEREIVREQLRHCQQHCQEQAGVFK